MDFDFTLPYALGDFTQWHKGISHYGFWALEINSEHLLTQIAKTQIQLSPWLQTGYQRQAHITLIACGLMAEDHFSSSTLAKQVNDLKQQNFNAFTIETAALNSFSTCPYISLSAIDPAIEKIRQRLSLYQTEDAPCHYTPHITLGFYNNKYTQQEIKSELTAVEKIVSNIKQPINSIIFARYKTAELQGAYEVIERIKLRK